MLELYVDGILYFCANVSEVRGVLQAYCGMEKEECRATVTLRRQDDSWYTYASEVDELIADIDAEWGRG